MQSLPGLDVHLAKRARAAAQWLEERRTAGDTVSVVHHIDADGVTSGAIALECLHRAGIPARGVPAKSLDDVHIQRVQDGGHDALWFCDFGSTAYMHFDAPRLVCDHHQLVRDGTEEDFAHLNPLLDGIEGDTISGAGCAFLAALAFDKANLDLLPVALVGAAADLQDRSGGFHGSNRVLLKAGIAAGLVEVERDLAWFGPETRPLRKFLAYGEPKVPGVTGDQRSAEAFLVDLGIPLLEDGTERTWAGLGADERLAVRSAIVERLLDCGLHDRAQDLWRDVVRITCETPGPTRELQEFGTLLNSTARYGEPETGLAVARGQRGQAYEDALGLLKDHRKHLVKSLDAFRHAGIEERVAVQWVHLEGHVRDTVVGIVCGMALEGLGLRRDMPLIGFAHTDDGRSKASARAPSEIQGRIDLATAMREAAAAVGGQGGGHPGAAGATINRGQEAAFLEIVDAVVARQLGRVGPAAVPDMRLVAQPAAPGAEVRESPGAETLPASQPWAAAKGQTRLF